MSRMEKLPSDSVEFVDDVLEDVFESADSGERVSVMIRPVASRPSFMLAVERDSFGENCERIATESISIDVTEDEYELLLSEGIIEAIEAVRPIQQE